MFKNSRTGMANTASQDTLIVSLTPSMWAYHPHLETN